MDNIPNYEVKILINPNLTNNDKVIAKEILNNLIEENDMKIHNDGVTYSKKPPYKKLSDIPSGFRFYNKLRKYKNYFSFLEYYNYLEGDINGRIIRSSC